MVSQQCNFNYAENGFEISSMSDLLAGSKQIMPAKIMATAVLLWIHGFLLDARLVPYIQTIHCIIPQIKAGQ